MNKSLVSHFSVQMSSFLELLWYPDLLQTDIDLRAADCQLQIQIPL